MNLPPDSPNERRAVPRHIRDGEHDMLHDAVEAGPRAENAGRRWRVVVYLVEAVALVLGLWFYNGAR
jgi:hypothetical protein